MIGAYFLTLLFLACGAVALGLILWILWGFVKGVAKFLYYLVS